MAGSIRSLRRPRSRESVRLAYARKPGVADHVGDQDRRQFPGLVHCGPPAEAKIAEDQRPLRAKNEAPLDPRPYKGALFSPVAKAYPSGTPTFRIIS